MGVGTRADVEGASRTKFSTKRNEDACCLYRAGTLGHASIYKKRVVVRLASLAPFAGGRVTLLRSDLLAVS